MKINLSNALKMIQAVEEHAKSINVPSVIVVVDEGANVVALHRMDDAILASIDIASNKAFTAVATKSATHQLGAAAQAGQPLFGVNTTNNGRIVIFGGGYPIMDNGKVIGGLGVSGGTVEEDMANAEVGLLVLNHEK